MDNAEQEAREPSAEQINEALMLRERFANGPVIYGGELAELIAHVRQQAERAALEKAAGLFDGVHAVCCGRGNVNGCCGDPYPEPDWTNGQEIADAIRALMQPEQKGNG